MGLDKVEYGSNCINENKFKIFNENMNIKFYEEILKEKNSEMKNKWGKSIF